MSASRPDSGRSNDATTWTRKPAALRAIAAILLAAVVSSAHAAGPAVEPLILDVDTFLAYQRTVRDEMNAGRRFKHVDNETKRKLFRAQDDLFRLLDGKESIDQLDESDKVAVYNAQHVVGAVLADAELDREVCKRERTLGSHRVMTTCMTIRERNEMLAQTQDSVRRMKTKACIGGGIGGPALLPGESGGAMVVNCDNR